MRFALSCFTATLLVGWLASAGDAPLAGTPSRSTDPVPAGPTGALLPVADPLAADLGRAIERHAREYVALHRQLVQARDEHEAFAIQREMRADRTALQVELLRIQAVYARRAGREDLAYEFERTIDALVRPEPRAADEVR